MTTPWSHLPIMQPQKQPSEPLPPPWYYLTHGTKLELGDLQVRDDRGGSFPVIGIEHNNWFVDLDFAYIRPVVPSGPLMQGRWRRLDIGLHIWMPGDRYWNAATEWIGTAPCRWGQLIVQNVYPEVIRWQPDQAETAPTAPAAGDDELQRQVKFFFYSRWSGGVR